MSVTYYYYWPTGIGKRVTLLGGGGQRFVVKRVRVNRRLLELSDGKETLIEWRKKQNTKNTPTVDMISVQPFGNSLLVLYGWGFIRQKGEGK